MPRSPRRLPVPLARTLALTLALALSACSRGAARPPATAPAVVEVGSEVAPGTASSSSVPPRRVAGCSSAEVDAYLSEMRGFMRDPAADSNTSAAKALALLGDQEAIRFLRSKTAADFDAFSLAALVLIGDEDARKSALDRARSVDVSEFTMLAYGFERRPDPTITARTQEIAKSHGADSEGTFAKALLASMGVGYGDEVARTMAEGASSRDGAFAARSLLRSHPDAARKVLEEVLQNPGSGSLDLAGSAFGTFPELAPIDLLVGAKPHADSPYDKIWLDYALVAACRR